MRSKTGWAATSLLIAALLGSPAWASPLVRVEDLPHLLQHPIFQPGEPSILYDDEGLAFARASTGPEHADWANLQVLLLDTLGDLPSAYGEGTVALVGGGWHWTGGHNPLEPVRWGLPTLLGPGRENFMDLTEPLLQEGRLILVPAERLSAALREALKDAPLRGPGFDQGPPLPDELRGALDRTWNLVEPFLIRSNRS